MGPMQEVLLIAATFTAIAASVSGFLGFVVYPKQASAGRPKTRPTGNSRPRRRGPPPRQGIARGLFIIFAAATFVCLFFGVFLG